mgnify:CR=1 FL=1
MATTIKLEGEARSEFGKGVARRLRVANKIPATIYAGGEEPAFVTLPMRETTLALRHTNALFTIAFDGNTKMAVVKDVQKNPVKRIIEHIDFYEVKAGEKIEVEVPVFVEGTPKGVPNLAGSVSCFTILAACSGDGAPESSGRNPAEL